MWNSMVDKVRKILSIWRGRFFPIVDRVTLINSVLNSIPIFILSFYKTPTKFLKEIYKIQSNFLWYDSEDRKTIHLVGLQRVCRLKEEGGIGIKNMELFNRAFFLKWNWRILVFKEAVWYGILNHRCQNQALKMFVKDNGRSNKR